MSKSIEELLWIYGPKARVPVVARLLKAEPAKLPPLPPVPRPDLLKEFLSLDHNDSEPNLAFLCMKCNRWLEEKGSPLLYKNEFLFRQELNKIRRSQRQPKQH